MCAIFFRIMANEFFCKCVFANAFFLRILDFINSQCRFETILFIPFFKEFL